MHKEDWKQVLRLSLGDVRLMLPTVSCFRDRNLLTDLCKESITTPAD